MSSTTQTIECGNCKTYGVFEDGELIVPCTNHARSNGWTWNGKKCYGSQDGETELSLRDIVDLCYYLIRTRLIGLIGEEGYPEYTSEQAVDEHILENSLPEEGKELYGQYVKKGPPPYPSDESDSENII